ncbi:helix-turn-helix domain-containing protein [Nocardia sp. NPDC051030]|uniref:helix-turn-helix domain-containing protein n=1 Tax=Nocardia sp. NPDC051030 TaxID=3155162 RepID=UPI0034407125
MRATGHEHDLAGRWDVARPSRPGRISGIGMIGFRDLSAGPVAQPVFPHPAVTVILQFGEGNLLVEDAAGREQRGSLVAGLGPQAIRMRGERIECVEMRISPVVAHAVLGTSLAELDHAVVAADDVWGRDAARIGQQLCDSPSWTGRFALAEEWMARRHDAGRAPDPEVAWAWNRIMVSRGGIRVEELAVEVGWSRKRLWSRFRSQLGVPPKLAAKLVRFDCATRRLVAGDSAARVAAEGGYVDQSHLHRDVLAFTGMTPARLAGYPGLVDHDIEWARPGTFLRSDDAAQSQSTTQR